MNNKKYFDIFSKSNIKKNIKNNIKYEIFLKT